MATHLGPNGEGVLDDVVGAEGLEAAVAGDDGRVVHKHVGAAARLGYHKPKSFAWPEKLDAPAVAWMARVGIIAYDKGRRGPARRGGLRAWVRRCRIV
jgi:hypothetical protein